MNTIVFSVIFGNIFIGACTAPGSQPTNNHPEIMSFQYDDENELESIKSLIQIFPFTRLIKTFLTPYVQDYIYQMILDDIDTALSRVNDIQYTMVDVFRKIIKIDDSVCMKLVPTLNGDTVKKIKNAIQKKLNDPVADLKFGLAVLKLLQNGLHNSKALSNNLAKKFEDLIVENKSAIKFVVTALVSPEVTNEDMNNFELQLDFASEAIPVQ